MKPAVFLDRDGVLNHDPPHYAHRLDQLALIPGSADAVKKLNDSGFLTIIISNQSGVARGFYTEKEIEIFNNALVAEIQTVGGNIDAIYYCPHHPEATVEQYRRDCECRKPKPGMIYLAAREHDIDLKHSFLVGDKLSDIEAGIRAGCLSILVLTGHGQDELGKAGDRCCLISRDLKEAVDRFICEAAS